MCSVKNDVSGLSVPQHLPPTPAAGREAQICSRASPEELAPDAYLIFDPEKWHLGDSEQGEKSCFLVERFVRRRSEDTWASWHLYFFLGGDGKSALKFSPRLSRSAVSRKAIECAALLLCSIHCPCMLVNGQQQETAFLKWLQATESNLLHVGNRIKR